MSTTEDTRVDGSERDLPPGAQKVGEVDASEQFDVSVMVRRKAGLNPAALAGTVEDDSLDSRRAARAAFADRYGASTEDLEAVARFADAHHLVVVTRDAARRTVVVRGTAADMSAAFGVTLARYELDGRTFRGRVGHAHVPAELKDIVTAVLGLDDRVQAHAYFRTGETLSENELPSPEPAVPGLAPRAAAAPPAPVATPLWAARVGDLYEFPTSSDDASVLDGTGQTIGIIELGGGYEPTDLEAYFSKANITEPTVTAVDVGTGHNQPGSPTGADGEVMLDIEVAGSIAPGATIAVYFAEDASDKGFLDALTTAIHDPDNAPSIISISWGGPERAWTAQGIAEFDAALQDAAALGITVTVAAGDHGAGDAAGDRARHADFPASSPHVIACGGTTLVADAAGIVSEVVWNDEDGWAGGGGVSTVFPQPNFQKNLPEPFKGALGTLESGRGVVDVAANADITSGYIIRSDGRWAPVGGTSAVAPLWAGLVARLNQGLGRPAGYLTPTLYGLDAGGTVFRDIVDGNNSVPKTKDFGPAVTGYDAGPGWDAPTGLGVARGVPLLAALKASRKAAPAPSGAAQ